MADVHATASTQAVSDGYPETGQTGAVVPKAETVQTALVERDGTAHHPAEVTWLGFDASGWVSLAMLVLIGIMIWKRVPQLIGAKLDDYSSKVKAELDEAARLRKEAEDLFATYKAQADQAAQDAKDILSNAKAEAARVVAEAKTQAEETVARRTRMAEEKIAAAERAAADDLRARAADLAVETARKAIVETSGAAVHKDLVDQAIGELDRRLH